MPITRYMQVSFGAGRTGLATVGYGLYDPAGLAVGVRTTTDVIERGPTGTYGAVVSLPDGFAGEIRWDSGEVTPRYASEDINPIPPTVEEIDAALTLSHGDGSWLAVQLPPPTGTGTIPVDHDFGGDDALRFESAPGVGIGNAEVRAYRRVDYDMGLHSSQYVVAWTTTGDDGRWRSPLMLDPGDYAILMASDKYQPYITYISVV
jgi:hypothetical protein